MVFAEVLAMVCVVMTARLHAKVDATNLVENHAALVVVAIVVEVAMEPHHYFKAT